MLFQVFQVFQVGLTIPVKDALIRILFILHSNEPIPILFANLFSSYSFFFLLLFTFVKCLFCSVTGQTNLEQTNKQAKNICNMKQVHKTKTSDGLNEYFIITIYYYQFYFLNYMCVCTMFVFSLLEAPDKISSVFLIRMKMLIQSLTTGAAYRTLVQH